ncbi:MAG: class III extradiol dioxygenase subunit B-like domain-containing protein [Actinomycetota bacterium]|nr:class III extradiol dioxygenase subunit B-like domain-containing protein [Actinomycetota bacterium]
MALVAAAVCPHPPLLVPEVAAGAAEELDDLRAGCDVALRGLLDADPGLVFVVGDAPARLAYTGADWGDLSAYGVAVSARLGSGACAGQPILPLSLTIGAWLVARTGWTGDRQGYGVPAGLSAAECAGIGREVADLDDRVALLVMGDGSARRTVKAPGYLDDRAAAFDARVAAALGSADTEALLGLEGPLAVELMVAGRASWQVLAGAAEGSGWHAELLHDDAPYGVAYLVATWLPAPV